MFAAAGVADKAAASTSEVLELMAADLPGLIHLRFGDELIPVWVPMQSLIAKQWSKVLATALEDMKLALHSKTIIPMHCSKEDWLTVARFIYPTSPRPAITWDNLEVSQMLASHALPE